MNIQILADQGIWIVVPIILIMAIELAVWMIFRLFHKRVLLVQTFAVRDGSNPEIGSMLADMEVAALQQVRRVHMQSQCRAELITFDRLDLPALLSRRYSPKLISQLESCEIRIPRSNSHLILRMLEKRCLRLTGNLSALGRIKYLTAWIENGGANTYRNKWNVKGSPHGNNVLGELADSLGFMVLFEVIEWGLRSITCLAHYTRGLQELGAKNVNINEVSSLQRAAIHFSRALEADPSNCRIMYDLAICRLGLAEYGIAIDLLNSVLVNCPVSLVPEIIYNLGVAYYHVGSEGGSELAEEEFSKLIHMLAARGQTQLTRHLPLLAMTHVGLYLADRTDPVVSSGSASNMFEVDESDELGKRSFLLALAHCGLGLVSAKQITQDVSGAELHFRRSIEQIRVAEHLASDHPQAQAVVHLARAISFLNMQNTKVAMQELHKAMQIRPVRARASFYLHQAELGTI